MLTIKEVAIRLQCDESTVRKLLSELQAVDLKQGKSKKRMIRIPEKGLDDYLKKCCVLPDVVQKQSKQQVDLSLFEPDGRIKRRRTA